MLLFTESEQVSLELEFISIFVVTFMALRGFWLLWLIGAEMMLPIGVFKSVTVEFIFLLLWLKMFSFSATFSMVEFFS